MSLTLKKPMLKALAVVSTVMIGMTTLSGTALADPEVTTVSAVAEDAEGFASLEDLDKYVEVYDTGLPYRFNIEKAQEDGLSETNIRVGEQFNELMFAQYDPYSRIKVYGNWCGPNWTNQGPPINKLDEICMHHDKCYDNHSNDRCMCDRELMDAIDRNWRSFPFTTKLAAKAIQLGILTQYKAHGCDAKSTGSS